MDKIPLHTISVLVANKPGVLVRIALVFARRGYNIDSLVVSPTVNPKFSRMTITAKGDVTTLEMIIKNVNKLVDVIHCEEHPADTVEKELALLKTKTSAAVKTFVAKNARKFRVRIDDASQGYYIIEQTGTTAELNEFETLLKKFGIVEMIRTGKILITRGRQET
ncbi:MAG: acetolactate synthase small subunit [Candidatus Omnitrophica bacterium]|nr:acetolactate synthase small subunit [Candidatus Omnitrophota bacterium]MDE2009005.1 acetolactate synthase small subunit [Candidatus Omnitrophota bacterium]MDE2214529.1 acetolactate synthase small subunit [Candidatus Omnitrophota bacterium]MDE2230847.1 acetolactate synthase small subunit [Candidatus Omnitrophota bacterium]